MIEMDDDSDEDDERDKELLYRAARKKFIDETRKTVQYNLKKAELPDQPVYIVSADALRNVVKNKKSMKIIDELELLRDLYVCVHKAWGLEVLDSSLKDCTVWAQSFQSSSRSSPSHVDMEVSKEWESVGFE
ncbi:hypothetical protein ID866_10514 [Astraeus odoratus]|nr:hypothetical protein ID866_10514 [Astraeus odoratus]